MRTLRQINNLIIKEDNGDFIVFSQEGFIQKECCSIDEAISFCQGNTSNRSKKVTRVISRKENVV